MHYFDTWELRDRLRKGPNVLAVTVRRDSQDAAAAALPGDALLADLTGPVGQPLVSTTAQWRVRTSTARTEALPPGGPAESGRGLPSERFDARQEPDDWRQIGFDDSSWPTATEAEMPSGAAVPLLRDLPLPRRTTLPPTAVMKIPHVGETIDSAGGGSSMPVAAQRPEARDLDLLVHPPEETGPQSTLLRAPPGTSISLELDFGRYVYGRPTVTVVSAAGGETVELRYRETLPTGEPTRDRPQSPSSVSATVPGSSETPADQFTCRPGRQLLETFSARGFRALRLRVRNAAEGIRLTTVSVEQTTVLAPGSGAFQCSDETFNRLWRAGRETAEVGWAEHPIASPTRLAAARWPELREAARALFAANSDARPIQAALMRSISTANGVPDFLQDGSQRDPLAVGAALAWIGTLFDYYQRTGDVGTVRAALPSVYDILSRLRPEVGQALLQLDQQRHSRTDVGELNARHYEALMCAEALRSAVNGAPTRELPDRASEVKSAFEALWDPHRSLYREPDSSADEPRFSEVTNALTVLLEIAPRARHEPILDALSAPPKGVEWIRAPSPARGLPTLVALLKARRRALPLSLLRERWGKMVASAGGTCWENWEPVGSLCYTGSAGVASVLTDALLGVRPLKPGFAEILAAPDFGDLTLASGVVPTPRGDVRLSWQRDPALGVAAVRVEAPPGTPLEVELPAFGEVRVERKVRLPAGAVLLRSAAGRIRYRFEKGGTYLFEL
jgi:hypothetical protein